jgi:ferredoxin-type protein NapG
MDRRRFFREGLRELLKPVSKAVEPIERVVHELGRLEPDVPPTPVTPPPSAVPSGAVPRGWQPTLEMTWLRPPGALQEDQFLSTCSRCSKCVEVCPVQCIKIDPERSIASGAPYIDVDSMPCVLCTGLECMHHCPSGALLPTPQNDIDMGTAVWHQHLCVRAHGEECTMCVDHCPVGSTALELIDDHIIVHEAGCVGCGVCQNNCPTNPKSITVTPKALRFSPG